MSENSLDSQHPITNLYPGLTDKGSFSRNAPMCEQLWNKEFSVGTFDSLLLEQLQLAEKTGRNEVIVLDIGSGDQGLYISFLNDPQLGLETRKFLASHPNLKLNMIGFTDAPDPQLMFQEAPVATLTNPDADNSQITTKNYYYSLTTNQTVKKFLQHFHIPKIDLALSTWALTYVGPSTFRNAIIDIIKGLRPQGGKFIGIAYAEQEIPGFKRPDPGLPHELDVRHVDHSSPSIKTTLSDPLRLFRKDIDPQVELANLKLAEKKMVSLGVLTDQEIKAAETDCQQKLTQWGNDSEDIIRVISLRQAQTLNVAVERLAKRKQQQLKEHKLAILTELKNNSQNVSLDFQDSTILINRQ